MKFLKSAVIAGVMVWQLTSNPLLSAQTLPLQSNMSDQEKANLQLILDWWREVLQARHVELIDQYADPNLIQHNPNFPQGTDALKQAFGRSTPVNPIPATLEEEPAIAMAQGDIVLLVWGHEAEDPADPSRTYYYNTFDGFRIEDNKIVEHWDAATKNAP